MLSTAEDLLDIPSAQGTVSDVGLRDNVSIALRYTESWLRGVGAAAIDNLMEDLATAEISRSLIWQWIHQDVRTTDGEPITTARVETMMLELLQEVERTAEDRFDDAAAVLRTVALGDEFLTFLTLCAYSRFLVEQPAGQLAA